MIVLLSLIEARKPGMNRLWGRGPAGSLIWWKAFFLLFFFFCGGIWICCDPKSQDKCRNVGLG